MIDMKQWSHRQVDLMAAKAFQSGASMDLPGRDSDFWPAGFASPQLHSGDLRFDPQ